MFKHVLFSSPFFPFFFLIAFSLRLPSLLYKTQIKTYCFKSQLIIFFFFKCNTQLFVFYFFPQFLRNQTQHRREKKYTIQKNLLLQSCSSLRYWSSLSNPPPVNRSKHKRQQNFKNSYDYAHWNVRSNWQIKFTLSSSKALGIAPKPFHEYWFLAFLAKIW